MAHMLPNSIYSICYINPFQVFRVFVARYRQPSIMISIFIICSTKKTKVAIYLYTAQILKGARRQSISHNYLELIPGFIDIMNETSHYLPYIR